MTAHIEHGDCLEVMRRLVDEGVRVDSIVTDPPYGIGFMGKKWDTPGSFVERKTDTTRTWDHVGGNHNPSNALDAARTRRRESVRFGRWCEDWASAAIDLLRPGGHLVAFGGTRTYHRLACAIEDAGFEIRDQIGWVFGSGFPKSHDVSKGIDRAAGLDREVIGRKADPRYQSPATAASGSPMGNISPRANAPENYARAGLVTAPATAAAQQWSGWGTALKPAWESIVVAQKPHDISQLCDIVARKIMGALCQLPSLAKDAAESSLLSRSVFGEAFGSAQWSAVAGCNTPADLFALTATWPCEWAIPSSLSIALSWLDILGASLSLGSTFTTETNASLTTDLKTLNSLLSKSTAAIIIEVATGPDGTGSSALLAARIFSAVSERLRITQELSAIGTATSKAGSAGLRPNWEPIVLARKPLIGTVAENVQKHRTGALNIDGCRVETDDNRARMNGARVAGTSYVVQREAKFIDPGGAGRWPANVIHDGSEEVLAGFPAEAGGGRSAARFFYCAKASGAERAGSKHPTVKPLALMRYLCRLVTPPGGTVLDPFAGSGSTLQAAVEEGFNAIGIEREAEYVADIERRLERSQPRLVA